MAEVENVAGVAGTIAVEHLAGFGGNDLRTAEQHVRVNVALQGDLVADAATGLADINRPVQTDRIATDGSDLFQPQATVLGEYDARDALAVLFLLQAGNDTLHVGQREFLIGRRRQRATPGIENHHCLGAGVDLGIQVAGHGIGGHRQDLVQQIGTAVHHALDVTEVAGALPFDHVAGECVGAAGETDQRHGVVERAADLGDGIHDVAKVLVGIRCRQVVDRPLLKQRTLELRALAFSEVQAKPHRVGHGQDVRKEDGSIQIVAGQRLQRHFAGHGRRFAQIEEIAGPLTGFAILRQVAASLTHQPERRVIGWLLEKGAQESVVAGSAHGRLRQNNRKAGLSAFPCRGSLALDQEMIKASLAPEVRRQNHQQCEDFETAEQHGEDADPGLEVLKHFVGGRWSDHAQSRPGVVNTGDDCGER